MSMKETEVVEGDSLSMTCSIVFAGRMVSEVKFLNSINQSISISEGRQGDIEVMAAAPRIESHTCIVAFKPVDPGDEYAQNTLQFSCDTEVIRVQCKNYFY